VWQLPTRVIFGEAHMPTLTLEQCTSAAMGGSEDPLIAAVVVRRFTNSVKDQTAEQVSVSIQELDFYWFHSAEHLHHSDHSACHTELDAIMDWVALM